MKIKNKYCTKKLDAEFVTDIFCNFVKKKTLVRQFYFLKDVPTLVTTTLLWKLETLKSNEYLVKYNMESPKAVYYVRCSFPGLRMFFLFNTQISWWVELGVLINKINKTF